MCLQCEYTAGGVAYCVTIGSWGLVIWVCLHRGGVRCVGVLAKGMSTFLECNRGEGKGLVLP